MIKIRWMMVLLCQLKLLPLILLALLIRQIKIRGLLIGLLSNIWLVARSLQMVGPGLPAATPELLGLLILLVLILLLLILVKQLRTRLALQQELYLILLIRVEQNMLGFVPQIVRQEIIGQEPPELLQ